MNWREILAAYAAGLRASGEKIFAGAKAKLPRVAEEFFTGAGNTAYNMTVRPIGATSKFFSRHPRTAKALAVGGVSAAALAVPTAFASKLATEGYEQFINQEILGSPHATSRVVKAGAYMSMPWNYSDKYRDQPYTAFGAYSGAGGSYLPREAVPSVNFTPSNGSRYRAPTGDIVFGMYNLRK